MAPLVFAKQNIGQNNVKHSGIPDKRSLTWETNPCLRLFVKKLAPFFTICKFTKNHPFFQTTFFGGWFPGFSFFSYPGTPLSGTISSKISMKQCIHDKIMIPVDLGCWIPRGDHLSVHSMSPNWSFLPCSTDVHFWVSGRWGGGFGEAPTWVYCKNAYFFVHLYL